MYFNFTDFFDMSDNICCRKSGETKNLELHHIVPKYMGGKDIDGRVYLSKKQHDILHNIIPSIIWKYVPEERKEDCRNTVKRFTLRWLKQ